MPRNVAAGLLTNAGPRHTQQARKGPIPSFANFGTHGNGPCCVVRARCSGGVPVGNVPDQNCSHLECSRRNKFYVQNVYQGLSLGKGFGLANTIGPEQLALELRQGRSHQTLPTHAHPPGMTLGEGPNKFKDKFNGQRAIQSNKVPKMNEKSWGIKGIGLEAIAKNDRPPEKDATNNLKPKR